MSSLEDRGGELSDTLRQMKSLIEAGDAKTKSQLGVLREEINTIHKRMQRPGGMAGGGELDTEAEHRQARGLIELKHAALHAKNDLRAAPFVPSPEQLDEGLHACRGLHNLFRCTAVDQLPDLQKKALSSFNMGASGFVLAPEMSNQILSCLVYPTDIAGLVGNVSTTSPSIKFLVDNVVLDQAAWACETSCFANNPNQQLNEGLGELEIKVETIRFATCATRDLLEDAALDMESFILEKVQRAFSIAISNAIAVGDGNGKPLGIFNADYQKCDTAPGTEPGLFDWRDLVALKWEVPLQFHAGAEYWMNQRTWALCLTMTDANGRPLMIPDPTEAGKYSINGSAVRIVTQMPDLAPGAWPVAFGNWRQAYMLVNRKSVTMMTDPYSAGFCVLYRFEARVGGAPTCTNAAKFLRIR